MVKGYQHVFTLNARSGDLEPLARHIAQGGELTLCMREFLVEHLMGKILFRRGRRRTQAKKEQDKAVGQEVDLYQTLLELSRSSAIERYLDDHPDTNPDTLKSTLKRYDADIRVAQERVKKFFEDRRVGSAKSR